MAGSAQSPATTATISPTGPEIKQEVTGLEGLGLSMSPEIATKRPLENTAQDPEPKRVKTEDKPEEESVEDGIALLIQNTLANLGDLVGHVNGDADGLAGGHEPMDIDHVPQHESTPAPIPPVTFYSDPEKYIRRTNIHALGNLAISFLLALSQRPADETLKWFRETDPTHTRPLRRLQLAFDTTRSLYSDDPVLVPDLWELADTDFHTIIELANLAKLGTWLIERDLGSLVVADTHFLSVFPSLLSDLPGDVSELYLAIKTQRAIEALLTKDADKSSKDVIVEAFTTGLEESLQKRPAAEHVASADQLFVSSVKSREEALLADTQGGIDQAILMTKYPEVDLLRHFTAHAKQRLASLTSLGDSLGVPIPAADDFVGVEVEPAFDGSGDAMIDLDDLSSFFEKTTSGLVQNALAGLTEEEVAPAATVENAETPIEVVDDMPKLEEPSSQTQANGKIDFMTDYKELEALVAESTADYVKTTLNGLSPMPYQPTVPASTAESMAAQSPYLSHLQQHQPQNSYYTYSQPVPDHQPPQPGPGGLLPPNQSLSSALLYDKARQAALSKSTAHTRREGLHSTRRPWTQEEEKALMAGLDMVKGPHWSQILTLFGQNGTISDILKERTQVQLKDKARNLKLFFLKTNSEMPYYLQAVTGELKTRAPTQAARKEAEERARLNSEEDQAKLQGIMALAGGLQHPPQSRSSGSPATSLPSTVVTPAQAASAAQASSSGQHTPTMHNSSTTLAPSTTHTSSQLGSAIQSKPLTPAAAQQALQAMPQASRPLGQFPPQIHRQQSQQPYQQPQHTPSAQPASQPQTQPQTQHLPTAHHAHPPPAAHQPAATQAVGVAPIQPQPTQHAPSPSLPPAQPASQSTSQPVAPPGPVATQTSPVQANHLPPPQVSQPVTPAHDDNSAEAALLKGLQAAVAEATS